MSYVDGFLIPISKSKLKQYKSIASKAGRIWREHGAVDYKECVADDINSKGFASFSKAARTKAKETVVFSYIVYKSKAHRNAVNKKVMNDPRIHSLCNESNAPFDPRRMAYGGFKVIVGA